MSAPDLWRTAVHGLVPALAEVSDAELLRRFHTSRDEAAFELLVYRHGPLVWAACRRMLRDHHAAEDAFQATFLALARQAASIREGRSVPGWLHRVAVRAGIHLRRRNRRALVPLDEELIDPARGPTEAAGDRETAAHIDAAINALSARLRQVFILCELHGYSLADAAARLGVPIGTVASRLGRARERLRKVLSARGLAVGSGLLTADVVPPAVRGASVRAAAGGAKITPMVSALARRAAGPAMRAPIFGLACSIAAGLIGMALALGNAEPPPATPKPTAKESPPADAVRTDAEGVPLPDGAVARLGSSRFRSEGWYFGGFDFSPDGRLIAGASPGGRPRVWEVATGQEVASVPPEYSFGSLHFTADGKHLVVDALVKSGGPELRCYEARTGRQVLRIGDDSFKVELGAVWRVGPNDVLWVVGTADKGSELRGIELPSGRVVDRTHIPEGASPKAVSSDGKRLLLRSEGKFTVLDTTSGASVWTFDMGKRRDAEVFLAGDGKLAVTREGSQVRIHNVADGRVTADLSLTAPGERSVGVTMFVPATGRYALACPYQTDRTDSLLIDLEEGRIVWKMRAFGVIFWQMSPDGRFLVVADQTSNTTVWDLNQSAARPVARLPRGEKVRFSPDGRTLALDGQGCVALYEVGTWKPLPQSASPRTYVQAVRFTPDSRGVVGLTGEGWRVWDDWTKAESRLLFGYDDGHRSRFSALSDDLQIVAETVGASDVGPGSPPTGEYRVTDRRTGRTQTFLGPRSLIREVVLSGDGRRAFTWLPAEGEVKGWDTASGTPLPAWRVAAQKGGEVTITASYDGRWLGLFAKPNGGPAAPASRGAWVGDVDRGREVAHIPEFYNPARTDQSTERFSRDGRRLAAFSLGLGAGPDARSEVRVWDWRTGRQFFAVRAYPSPGGVDLSPDGRSCVAGDQRELRVIEVASGGQRASFKHEGDILSVAFHPDGLKLVSSSPEAPIYVWDLLANPGRWDPTRADATWADLASHDVKTAYAAIRKLRANPAEAVTFLKDRVKVPAVPADDTIAAWLKALDSPAFADREKAQRELTAAAGLIRPKLEAARKTASAEAGRRLDQVLKAVDEQVTPDGLRQIRACEVLEGIRSPEAIRVLKAWSGGPAGYRLTIEATESLERLNK